jgi:hypothetical protein
MSKVYKAFLWFVILLLLVVIVWTDLEFRAERSRMIAAIESLEIIKPQVTEVFPGNYIDGSSFTYVVGLYYEFQDRDEAQAFKERYND